MGNKKPALGKGRKTKRGLMREEKHAKHSTAVTDYTHLKKERNTMFGWIDLRYYYAQKTNQGAGRGWDFRP